VAPKETYAGQSLPMEPYYILMRLPGSNHLQYLLMTPFTPQNRDNMISWMAARCDFPDYGKMLFYRLPKDKLIYGPSQIEAMIDQNTDISRQVNLWDQRGSRVIRGTLIVTPIENSFLYIVPLYLQAEGTNFPQLKRVIAVTADKVVMEPTLDEAINNLFGTQQPVDAVQGSAQLPTTPQPALMQARMQLDLARKAMQQGNWAAFGTAMEGLEHQLAGQRRPGRTPAGITFIDRTLAHAKRGAGKGDPTVRGADESDPKARAGICRGLSWIGVSLDEVRNRSATNPIGDPASRCAILVLGSQEDAQIARHTWALLPPSLFL